MNQQKLGFIIDMEIKKNYKSRRQFAKKTGRSYTHFTKLISEMIKTGNTNVGIKTITSIMNDVGLQFIIKKLPLQR